MSLLTLDVSGHFENMAFFIYTGNAQTVDWDINKRFNEQ